MGVVRGEEEAEVLPASALPAGAVAEGRRARAEAERAEPVIQAFGRALARVLVRRARARRAGAGLLARTAPSAIGSADDDTGSRDHR